MMYKMFFVLLLVSVAHRAACAPQATHHKDASEFSNYLKYSKQQMESKFPAMAMQQQGPYQFEDDPKREPQMESNTEVLNKPTTSLQYGLYDMKQGLGHEMEGAFNKASQQQDQYQFNNELEQRYQNLMPSESDRSIASLQQGPYFTVLATLFFKYTSDNPGSYYEAWGEAKIHLDTDTFTMWSHGISGEDVRLGSGKTVNREYSVNSIKPIRIEGDLKEDDDFGTDTIARFDETIIESTADLDSVFGTPQTYGRYTGGDGYAEMTIQITQGARLVMDLRIGYTGNNQYYRPHGTINIHRNYNRYTFWDRQFAPISSFLKAFGYNGYSQNQEFVTEVTNYDTEIDPTNPTASLRITGLVFESEDYNLVAVINTPEFSVSTSNSYRETFTGEYGYASITVRVETA